ncbi:MAG: hypothetical protein IMF05_12755 [Proteobacteria bacterium]|nr:hypothetical protein [Pseudomonadota bacterium]
MAGAGSTGGAAGNTSASLVTGSISSVSVSNVSGIVSMPMNTGINSNMVQSVSVNAQSNF